MSSSTSGIVRKAHFPISVLHFCSSHQRKFSLGLFLKQQLDAWQGKEGSFRVRILSLISIPALWQVNSETHAEGGRASVRAAPRRAWGCGGLGKGTLSTGGGHLSAAEHRQAGRFSGPIPAPPLNTSTPTHFFPVAAAYSDLLTPFLEMCGLGKC